MRIMDGFRLSVEYKSSSLEKMTTAEVVEMEMTSKLSQLNMVAGSLINASRLLFLS